MPGWPLRLLTSTAKAPACEITRYLSPRSPPSDSRHSVEAAYGAVHEAFETVTAALPSPAQVTRASFCSDRSSWSGFLPKSIGQ
jgi:hypothetical protein